MDLDRLTDELLTAAIREYGNKDLHAKWEEGDPRGHAEYCRLEAEHQAAISEQRRLRAEAEREWDERRKKAWAAAAVKHPTWGPAEIEWFLEQPGNVDLMVPKPRPPLNDVEQAIYEMLLELPESAALRGKAILDRLLKKNRMLRTEQSTLTSRIIPKLKEYYNVESTEAGYRIRPDERVLQQRRGEGAA